ncbi:hypothetical protein VULLAG_LOCUS21534 [Vulpes lagopus]
MRVRAFQGSCVGRTPGRPAADAGARGGFPHAAARSREARKRSPRRWTERWGRPSADPASRPLTELGTPPQVPGLPPAPGRRPGEDGHQSERRRGRRSPSEPIGELEGGAEGAGSLFGFKPRLRAVRLRELRANRSLRSCAAGRWDAGRGAASGPRRGGFFFNLKTNVSGGTLK